MKRWLSCVVLCGLGCGTSQSVWRPAATLPHATAADYPDAPAVILERDLKIDVVAPLRTAAYHRVERHQLLAILTRGSFPEAQVRIPLDEETNLLYLRARTISPEGRVDEVKPEEVLEEQARAGTDGKGRTVTTKVFRFPSLAVGSRLEYTYAVEVSGVLWWRVERIGSEIPVRHYHLEMTLSPTISFALKTYNFQVPFRQTQDANGYHVSLDVDGVPGGMKEALSPPWQLNDPWWAYRSTAFARGRYVQAAYESWDSTMEAFAKSLYEDTKRFAGADLRFDKGACGSERRCLLDRAVAFLRDKTALVRFVTHAGTRPLREALSSGLADSFEKAFLLWGALKAAGIGSSFALVGRDPGLRFDHAFPLPKQFDHLILLVHRQPGIAEPLFVDPSCEACAPGQLADWNAAREALVLRDDRNAGLQANYQFEFVDVRGAAPVESVFRRSMDTRLEANGDLSGDWTIEDRGAKAVEVQIDTRAWLPDRWREFFTTNLHDRSRTARLVSNAPPECDRSHATCRLQARFTIAGYAAAETGRLTVPLTLLRPLDDKEPFQAARQRSVFVGRAQLDEDELTIRLPAGFVAEELPAPVSLQSPAADLRIEVSTAPGVVTVRRAVQYHAGMYPRESWQQLDALLRAQAALRQQVFVLRPAQP